MAHCLRPARDFSVSGRHGRVWTEAWLGCCVTRSFCPLRPLPSPPPAVPAGPAPENRFNRVRPSISDSAPPRSALSCCSVLDRLPGRFPISYLLKPPAYSLPTTRYSLLSPCPFDLRSPNFDLRLRPLHSLPSLLSAVPAGPAPEKTPVRPFLAPRTALSRRRVRERVTKVWNIRPFSGRVRGPVLVGPVH